MTLGGISYPLQVQKLLPSEDIILSVTGGIITTTKPASTTSTADTMTPQLEGGLAPNLMPIKVILIVALD